VAELVVAPVEGEAEGGMREGGDVTLLMILAMGVVVVVVVVRWAEEGDDVPGAVEAEAEAEEMGWEIET
jgi:hypothetical protein